MSLPLILCIGAVCLILIVIIVYQYLSRTGGKKEHAMRDYAEALNYLIAGNLKEALEKLRRSVRIDTDNVDAYIKIGDLFRKMGKIDKAIKVHLDLTVREGVSHNLQLQIYRSLVLDFHSAGDYTQALLYVERILDHSKDDQWGMNWKLRLSELSKDWETAFSIHKRIQKKSGRKDSAILALYRVELGRELEKKKKFKEARIRYREALKIDSTCVPAYLQLCDSYIRENRNTDALHELRRLITAAPRWSHLAFDRIKDILFDVGSYSDIENVYQSIIKHDPAHLEAYIGLASLHEKKGELYRALELCHKALKIDATSIKAQGMLARLYQSVGKYQDSSKYALQAIEQLADASPHFHCKQCGFETDTPFWHCEQCGAWNSALG